MGLKDRLQSIKGLSGEALSSQTQQAIENHWPKIVQIFHERIGPRLKDLVDDNKLLLETCHSIYDELPLPIRLLVKEKHFVDFCIAHKDRLLVSRTP